MAGYFSPDRVVRDAVLQTQSKSIGRQPISAQIRVEEQEHAPDDQLRESLRRAEQEKAFAVLAEEARLSGFEKGRGEGFAKGLESAKQSLTERVLKLDALVAMLESARMSLAKSVEDDMIELVFSSLCRLLADEVISRDAVRAKIRANIERYSSEGIVNVHLAPSDYEWVQTDESLNSVLAKHSQASAIRWLPDRAVAAGGCVIECGSTAIDARLETQLEGIKEELLRVRRETRAVR